MTARIVGRLGGIAVGVLVIMVSGCSSDTSATATTSTVAPSTTVVPVPTPAASTTAVTNTTTPAATSSVLTPATSTTGPPTTSVASTPASTPAPTAPVTSSNPSPPPSVTNGAALVLRDNSLGDAAFGADPDAVIATITGVIGAPTLDSGWMDPLSLGSCPGTEVRTVTWGVLVLFFSDESRVVSGRRHFFAYSYGPAAGGSLDPAGLQTAAGIGVGSTVAQLRAVYPGIAITPADATAPAGFQASPALTGLLTSDQDTGTVTEVSGGFGCGE